MNPAARRLWLRRLALAPAAWWLARAARAQGSFDSGVYRVRGDARINGAPARPGAAVSPGDRVVTGPNGEVTFVAGSDAFLVRARADVALGGGALAAGLRVATGAVLSVFAPGEARSIRTPTATIGIRGTGVYVEALRGKTYVCTCYGVADIEPLDDPGARETVRTTHHEQPRYVMAKGAPQMMMKAPVINHSDAELALLEALVGRRPPFGPDAERY